MVGPKLDWLVSLPNQYLERKVYSTTLAEVRKLTQRSFIKSTDDKAFCAAIYESGALLDASHLYEPDLPVLVSDPVNFVLEYRMFVLERKIATFSLYAHEGALVEFPNGYTIEEDASGGAALTFARQVLDDPEVYFPPAVVFDIGKISTGKWIVIECNPAWGSGIYGCDPFQVLPVLKRACVPAELAADHDPRAFMFR